MITYLRGPLIHKQPPILVIEAGGIGYEVEAPMSTFYVLPEVGEEVRLHTHLHIREDAHQLFGFSSEQERSLFRTLIKVNGVGVRVALGILSGMEADTFMSCIRQGDSARLVRLPGIGKKTAERLIIELRDRLPAPISMDPSVSLSAPNPVADCEEEAVSALIALGYRPPDASRMIAAVVHDGQDAENLIRLALKAVVK